MNKPGEPPFFNKEASQSYDERNRRLAPIADNMHFLVRLVLQSAPARSRVLCVGVGTGAEIFSLAGAFPEWTFVGVDPSDSMLEVCRAKLEAAGIMHRCELIRGYVDDVPPVSRFDVALSILVAHFIPRAGRAEFFRNMTNRLNSGGFLVNTEISFDLKSPQFPEMLESWARVQSLMGATPEMIASLSKALREVLGVLPPEETEAILVQNGIERPVRFFQALMIVGWFGRKP